jgi:hypothetical protein
MAVPICPAQQTIKLSVKEEPSSAAICPFKVAADGPADGIQLLFSGRHRYGIISLKPCLIFDTTAKGTLAGRPVL